MEPILIKEELGCQYFFYPCCIKKRKKGKEILEIRIDEIEKITYNLKYSFKDFFLFLTLRQSPGSEMYAYKSLSITLKIGESLLTRRRYSFRVSEQEYNLLSKSFNKEIELI